MLAAEANADQYRVVSPPDDPDDFRIHIGDGLGHTPRIEGLRAEGQRNHSWFVGAPDTGLGRGEKHDWHTIGTQIGTPPCR